MPQACELLVTPLIASISRQHNKAAGATSVPPDRFSTYDRRQERVDELNRRREEEARRRVELRQKRLAQIEEECIRNRGTDCKNPEVLRQQEAQEIPRPYIPRVRK